MSLKLDVTPQDFFKEQLILASKNQEQNIDPPELLYISSLMSDFIQTKTLFQEDPVSNKMTNETLAFLYQDALTARTKSQAMETFRRMGDVSMVVSGFFGDQFSSKIIDVDYYVEMGGNAYIEVAARTTKEDIQWLFQNLSVGFNRNVNLLTEVAERSFAQTTDILRTYEKWLRTKNVFLQEKLREQGIEPQNQKDVKFKQ